MKTLATYDRDGDLLHVFAYQEESFAPDSSDSRRGRLRAPGAGELQIERPELVMEDLESGGELFVKTRVRGSNVAFVYVELLLKDPASERFYGPVVREHVRADRDVEVRGMRHPEWTDPVEIEARVRPALWTLTGAEGSAFCFCEPVGYESPESRLNGLYSPAAGDSSYRSVVTFAETGAMRSILAYRPQGGRTRSQGGRLGPRAVTPKPGDRFTPFVQVLTPAVEEGGAWRAERALGDSVAILAEPFRMTAGALVPGEYLAGLAIQDLDGSFTRAYASPVVLPG
ncbi:MAG: hypothetical protein JW990_18670 [Thermoleophilia bacterium]|nr:hypothetical protein [Thermoleophilia bacterium]